MCHSTWIRPLPAMLLVAGLTGLMVGCQQSNEDYFKSTAPAGVAPSGPVGSPRGDAPLPGYPGMPPGAAPAPAPAAEGTEAEPAKPEEVAAPVEAAKPEDTVTPAEAAPAEATTPAAEPTDAPPIEPPAEAPSEPAAP